MKVSSCCNTCGYSKAFLNDDKMRWFEECDKCRKIRLWYERLFKDLY